MTNLETERLYLRWLTPDDREFMLALLNSPGFLKNIGDRNVRTAEAAAEYIVKMKATSYDLLGFGSFIVELKATQEKLGICSLVKREGLTDIDIGFAFLPEYHGKGYALESTEAVMKYCKEDLKLPRIVGICDPTNQASIQLLEKIGLLYEESMILNDRPTLLYGLNLQNPSKA